MKRLLYICLITCLACLTCIETACAQEKAEQLKRDAERLHQIKKIALVPVVIQVRFDQDKRIPDPRRMSARLAVATRMATMLEDQMKSSDYLLLPPEAAVLAVKEMGWQPTDLYVTDNKGTWEAPAETIRNNKGDEAVLLSTRDEMKKTPEAMTLFRYKWHDLPDIAYGLAAFKLNAMARIDLDKARQLGDKLGADALLYCQVGDMEVHEGTTLFEYFKSTRIHLYTTLVSPQDGAVLWQARVRGIHSHKAGFFTGTSAYQAEDGMAIEGAMQAIKTMLEDLAKGTGNPVAASPASGTAK